MSKMKVAVIYGGRSGEHEVSLVSARYVVEALNKEKYEVIPIKINKDGSWDGPIQIYPDPTRNSGLDVVFPVLHGPYGEDGTIQGLLDMAGLPYVGAGVAASAAALDKALMRSLFKEAGLPLLPWEVVYRYEWERDTQAVVERLEASLTYPLFVKPANLGSSVGISKVKERSELAQAMEIALEYDRKAVVEQGAVGVREIECGVLGYNDLQASVPGEVVPAHEFYDYEAKYHSEDSRLIIPAPIGPELTERIQELAMRAFRAVDCSGMGRVDFFLTQQNEILVNEINTTPGFTPISMYPKLWESSGLPYSELLDRLIELALKRHKERQNLRISPF
ncbi:MAG: D-alanine--D-alanine ligase [Firmicutes bacterium]|jgi:D-alanine-D-alanine ligase|nr:D-alanine--D-alanine ligase family protein [Bacillota bacterium]NLO66151.1 D-alanine--D-alanine ligase [Bacillota bacterium]